MISLPEGQTQVARPTYAPKVQLPLVSVIITNYNYGHYLAEAVESVRAQTYARIECIVVDDCSTDGSFEAVEQLLKQRHDDRFCVIQTPRNVGQMAALKLGLQSAKGHFIVSLDADDILMPEFVRTHVECHLNGAFSAGLSASDTIQIDGEGNILEATYCTLGKQRSASPEAAIKPVLPSAVNTVAADKLQLASPPENPIYHIDRTNDGWHGVALSAFMFRRDMLDLIIPDDCESARICADFYLITFAHQITGTLTIWKQLSYYRLHGKNGFASNPILGSDYMTGFFDPFYRDGLKSMIADHIASHAQRMVRILGEKAIEIFKKNCQPHRIAELLAKHRDFAAIYKPGTPLKEVRK
jgi:glycosyltransferase involved in cell wall biosynthesis